MPENRLLKCICCCCCCCRDPAGYQASEQTSWARRSVKARGRRTEPLLHRRPMQTVAVGHTQPAMKTGPPPPPPPARAGRMCRGAAHHVSSLQPAFSTAEELSTEPVASATHPHFIFSLFFCFCLVFMLCCCCCCAWSSDGQGLTLSHELRRPRFSSPSSKTHQKHVFLLVAVA